MVQEARHTMNGEKTAEISTILWVDDDPHLLAWVGATLGDRGHRVLTEADPGKALGYILKNPPDLILLDANMPGMSGYDLCARLQERGTAAFTPVIFVTSLDGVKDKARAFTAGAADYLIKPIEEDELLRKIDLHLRTRKRWKTLAQSPEERPLDPGSAVTRLATCAAWEKIKDKAREFAAFRQYLAAQPWLPGDVRARLARLTPSFLYSNADELGLSKTEFARAIAEFVGLPFAEAIDSGTAELGVFPTAFCKANQVVAVTGPGATRSFFLTNPFNWVVIDALSGVLAPGEAPRVKIVRPESFEAFVSPSRKPPTRKAEFSEIAAQLKKEYEGAPSASASESVETSTEESSLVVQLVNNLIEAAYKSGASDIHIEPCEGEVIVRYRIDGDLRVVNRLQPASIGRPIISRLKIMSQLDIAEHRLPQDGRIKYGAFNHACVDFDLRLAILPENWGEKACLRIIDKQKSALPLPALGFSEHNLRLYREKIKSPYGMVLHVGPTGSGKSMSLYAALNEAKSPALNIQTAEDPIEYTLPGINQLQVNSEIGLTFQRALRGFLRADPDIILVGEIRDRETAQMAIEASLTGHLLLSTLHTNDAASTVTRFIEMGIEPYLVSSSLVLVCAQRLLRRLCPECKEGYSPSARERECVGISDDRDVTLWRPRGCSRCGDIGYKGRISVHELLVPDDRMRLAINEKGFTSERLKRIAVEEGGMVTLYWDAMEKVLQGISTLEDALSNVRADEFDSRPRTFAISRPPLEGAAA